MFGVDFSELLIIGVVALIVFGPDKLPEFSRQLGKFLGQLRRTTDGLRREFYNDLYPPADEIRREMMEIRRGLRTVSCDVKAPLEDLQKELRSSDTTALSETSTSVKSSEAVVSAPVPAPTAERKE